MAPTRRLPPPRPPLVCGVTVGDGEGVIVGDGDGDGVGVGAQAAYLNLESSTRTGVPRLGTIPLA
jgi:hypothetical protein